MLTNCPSLDDTITFKLELGEEGALCFLASLARSGVSITLGWEGEEGSRLMVEMLQTLTALATF